MCCFCNWKGYFIVAEWKGADMGAVSQIDWKGQAATEVNNARQACVHIACIHCIPHAYSDCHSDSSTFLQRCTLSVGTACGPNPFLTSWPVDVHHLQVYTCLWGYAESWSNICRKQFAERLEVIAYPERERRRIVGAALGVSLHCVQCKPPTIQCNNIWLPSHAHNTWLMHCLHYCSCLMSSYAA